MSTARHRLMKVGSPQEEVINAFDSGGLAQSRILFLQEFKDSTRQKPGDTGITLIPNEDNLFAWKAHLQASNTQHSSSSLKCTFFCMRA